MVMSATKLPKKSESETLAYHSRFWVGESKRGVISDPEVRLDAMKTPSYVFWAWIVIHCVAQFLFAS
jgi:hypothetical protein